MESLSDFFEFETIKDLVNAIEGLVDSLLDLFSNTFSWLGTGILTAIGIGATIAIILRILGR